VVRCTFLEKARQKELFLEKSSAKKLEPPRFFTNLYFLKGHACSFAFKKEKKHGHRVFCRAFF